MPDRREWISTQDRLPPDGVDVWIKEVYDSEHESDLGLAMLHEKTHPDLWFGVGGNYFKTQITHWAYQCAGDPLHEPEKAEDKTDDSFNADDVLLVGERARAFIAAFLDREPEEVNDA